MVSTCLSVSRQPEHVEMRVERRCERVQQSVSNLKVGRREDVSSSHGHAFRALWDRIPAGELHEWRQPLKHCELLAGERKMHNRGDCPCDLRKLVVAGV